MVGCGLSGRTFRRFLCRAGGQEHLDKNNRLADLGVLDGDGLWLWNARAGGVYGPTSHRSDLYEESAGRRDKGQKRQRAGTLAHRLAAPVVTGAGAISGDI